MKKYLLLCLLLISLSGFSKNRNEFTLGVSGGVDYIFHDVTYGYSISLDYNITETFAMGFSYDMGEDCIGGSLVFSNDFFPEDRIYPSISYGIGLTTGKELKLDGNIFFDISINFVIVKCFELSLDFNILDFTYSQLSEFNNSIPMFDNVSLTASYIF